LKISTRTLAPLDLDDVVEVERRAHVGSSWTRGKLAEELDHDKATVQGVFVDEALVGFACWRRMVDELWLLELAVDPDVRRRGHGRRLVEEGVELAQQGGQTSVWLEVRQSNAPAKALYRAAGFAPVTVRRRYYADGEDAVLMKREL
jgi:ribosomal-protein-alanine N-acetyltransferase